jgi:parvulin-like peptidyl-prolyl isomerase
MKKNIIFHVALLAVIVITGGVAYFRYWNIATVNGVPISRLDYIKTLEKQGGKQILDVMVEETLILNEAANKNVKIEQKAIDDEITKVESQLKAQGQTLEAALEQSNMTREDLEKQIRLRLIETTLSASNTEITQAQIDEFLKTNKELLPTDKTKEELQTLAKEQLALEASESAATAWLNNLRQSAKVVYK